MILPYTTMSGNVEIFWVLTLLSTDQYISGQGGIVDAVYYLCAKSEGKDVLPTASTGFACCCRQAPGLGCTETTLLLMVLQSGAGVAVVCVVTRTHTQPSSVKRGIRRGTQQATTPAVTFCPRRDGAGSNKRN